MMDSAPQATQNMGSLLKTLTEQSNAYVPAKSEKCPSCGETLQKLSLPCCSPCVSCENWEKRENLNDDRKCEECAEKKEYVVLFERKDWSRASVIVEAKDEEEARILAMHEDAEGNVEFEYYDGETDIDEVNLV